MPFPESKPLPEPENAFQFVIFRLGSQNFAIEIKRVLEVLSYCKITPVPGAPDFLEGVIDLRGDLIPMIDLRKRFQLPVRIEMHTRVLVLRMKGMKIGFIVDGASDVLTVPFENIQPPPPVVRKHTSDHVLAVAKNRDELYLILDLDRLLTSDEQIKLNDVNVHELKSEDVPVPRS